MNNDLLNHCAREMVNLTYQLEKVCGSKEILFCKDLEITPSEFRFLRHIKEWDEINAKDIATIMNSTAPRVSKLLNDLKKKDFVKINKDNKDKRYSLVSLSKKGALFIDNIMDKYIKFHEDMLFYVNKDGEDLSKIITTLKDFETMIGNFCLSKR